MVLNRPAALLVEGPITVCLANGNAPRYPLALVDSRKTSRHARGKIEYSSRPYLSLSMPLVMGRVSTTI